MRAAESCGEHIGRPPALSPLQIRKAKLRRVLDRGESPNHVARDLRVGRSTRIAERSRVEDARIKNDREI
jgi:hypothetical protein